MTPIRSTPRGVIACLTLAIAGLSACAAPKKGADRFTGTFRWRQSLGYQAVAFGKNGRAQYIVAVRDDDNIDSTKVDTHPSTYRVAGDTAFLLVDWGDPDTENDTLPMLLRGDSLIVINEVLGGNPVFVRDQ